jgi:hypothetical protein
MLKSHFFHANSQDKIPKLHDQLNQFFNKLDEDAIVSVNTTEFGPAGSHDFYSYTVLVVYKEQAAEV